MTLPNQPIGLTVSPTTTTPNARLSALWKQAVDNFIFDARLSGEERLFLENCHSPEETFNLVKHGWERHRNKREWDKHDSVLPAVTHVLMLFDVIDAVLGLAAVVWNLRTFK
jgi:hypothetical protein